jgi:hypothetical protein
VGVGDGSKTKCKYKAEELPKHRRKRLNVHKKGPLLLITMFAAAI